MDAMNLIIQTVDFYQSTHRDALVMLLDAYAQDPMGGGEPLAAGVKARLCDDMAARPTVASFIAWLDGVPVGLVNCVEGFSTFKSRPTDTNTCKEGLTKVDAVRAIFVVAISLFKDTPFTF